MVSDSTSQLQEESLKLGLPGEEEEPQEDQREAGHTRAQHRSGLGTPGSEGKPALKRANSSPA